MMDKTQIINRAIISLVQQRVVSPFDESKLRTILEQVYQAGYEVKRKDKNTYKLRPCAKYDLFGRLVERYDSITEAAQKNGIDRHNVWKRLNGLRKNDRYEWKYL